MHIDFHEEISSVQNPRIKQIVTLRERSTRDETDLFLIEGYRELLRAVENSQQLETLFFSPTLFLGSNESSLIELAARKGSRIVKCSEKVFRKISYRDRPDGLLSVALQPHRSLQDLNSILNFQASPLLVVAEAIEKPGNLGTILRSSDAVGVNGVIIADRCTDVFNPNVVRASVGTLFTVPVVEAGGLEILHWLKQRGVKILAATPSAELEFTDVNMQGPLAIAVGTEQLGLSKLWMENANIQVRIPMCGTADSLNVAMATTLLLYEALRQRKRGSIDA